jgi:hypothetical protein
MFSMIKSLIVLCMIIGVIILGARIHQKSSQLDKEIDLKHEQVKGKISSIKKDVLTKTEDLGKVYENVNKKLDAVLELGKTENGKDNATDKEAQKKELALKSEAAKKKITIDPIDEEDRALTEEILKEDTGKKDQTELVLKMDNNPVADNNQKVPLQISLVEEKKFTPMDLNKAAEIRELYLKAVKALDFK